MDFVFSYFWQIGPSSSHYPGHFAIFCSRPVRNNLPLADTSLILFCVQLLERTTFCSFIDRLRNQNYNNNCYQNPSFYVKLRGYYRIREITSSEDLRDFTKIAKESAASVSNELLSSTICKFFGFFRFLKNNNSVR